jgi:hypothetical protein
MRTFAHMSAAALAAGALVLLAAAGLGAASAGPAGATGCSQLDKMASVFPSAKRVGFIKRDAVKREHARDPIWPGWCGRRYWWTTYTARKTSVDVSVALYASAHDVGAALAEPAYPAYGLVQVQSNGSRVRAMGPALGSVNGAPSSDIGVVSAYRNLFVSSLSISTRKTPVPIAAQLRIHRAIETAFRSLR